MKKILSAAVIIMIMAFLTMPVFAHGHSGYNTGHRVKTITHSVCTVKSCTMTGLHKHDGITYSAHHYSDGHTYHRASGRHH